MLSPDAPTTRVYGERLGPLTRQHDEDGALARTPAVTADGRRIAVMINVAALADLAGLDPECCDGIGLLRTELLFHEADPPPGEELQLGFYQRFIEWAAGNPVTIRTLDVGGDKPMPGLSVPGEANPFLGVRGIRLCFARPEVFRTQLRALARAAALGPLEVMLPMVTVPDELVRARQMLERRSSRCGPPASRRRAPGRHHGRGAGRRPGHQPLRRRFLFNRHQRSRPVRHRHQPRLGRPGPAARPTQPGGAGADRAVATDGSRRGKVSVCGDMGPSSDPGPGPAAASPAGITSLSVAPAAPSGPVKRRSLVSQPRTP